MSRILLLPFAAAALLAAAPAGAAEIHNADGLTVDLGLKVGLGFYSVDNPWFGALPDATWGEGYVAPSLRLDYATGAGTFYGGLRVVAGATRGDGDALGLTPNDPEDADLDHAYLGWRSGTLFGLGEDAVDISFGRQDFSIGDGFLIADGHFEAGDEALYWMGARAGWKNSAIVRFNTQPVRGDVFYLHAHNDDFGMSSDNKIVGANIEYTPWEGFTAGATSMKIIDSRLASRDGMWVHSLRAQGAPFASMPDIFLSTEYVHQRNHGNTSWAWYGEGAYTFSDVAWSPKVGYRYSHFEHDYDALHYGMMRAWGAWFQGEITGQYGAVFNGNSNIHHLQFAVSPTESVAASLLYYSYGLDQSPGVDSHYGQEINLILDLFPAEWAWISGVYGYAWPGDGGKQAFGDEKTHLFQLVATLTF